MGQALMKRTVIVKAQAIAYRLLNEAYEIEQLASLSYEDLLNSVSFLNQVSESFGDFTEKRLAFVIYGEPDGTIWWRNNIKIKCYKVSSTTGIIQSTYLLNMKDFVHIYNEITTRAASISKIAQDVIDKNSIDHLSTSQTNLLDASLLLTGIDDIVTLKEEEDFDECTICMDRKARIILPCAHCFCEQCIDSWQTVHGTCPTCRTIISRPQDSWVLSEIPTDAEMSSEANNYVLSLIDQHPTVDLND